MTTKQTNLEIIEFVKETTKAITIISESIKVQTANTEAIKEMVNTQNTTSVQTLERMDGKMDALYTMFKYVIIPLIAGILSMVGVKFIFNQ